MKLQAKLSGPIFSKQKSKAKKNIQEYFGRKDLAVYNFTEIIMLGQRKSETGSRSSELQLYALDYRKIASPFCIENC